MDHCHGQFAALALDDHFRARTYAGQHRGEVAGGFGFRDVDPMVGHGAIIPSSSVSAIYSTFANFKLSHYATRTIRRRSGLKNALNYLVSEKLLNFAGAVERHSEFAAELPTFQAAVWEVFHP